MFRYFDLVGTVYANGLLFCFKYILQFDWQMAMIIVGVVMSTEMVVQKEFKFVMAKVRG